MNESYGERQQSREHYSDQRTFLRILREPVGDIDGKEINFTILDKANMRDVVVFGDAQADRSPGGTATSAQMATLHKRGDLGVGEPFVYESFMCALFRGEIIERTKVGEYDAVISKVTGSSYLMGGGNIPD